MTLLKKDDNCRYCKKHKIWSSNHRKANCSSNIRDQGFDPDTLIPAECIGKNYSNKKK